MPGSHRTNQGVFHVKLYLYKSRDLHPRDWMVDLVFGMKYVVYDAEYPRGRTLAYGNTRKRALKRAAKKYRKYPIRDAWRNAVPETHEL